MARVINHNTPGKRRSHRMRMIAEIMRRLAEKQGVDEGVKDMLAETVYCLREIGATVEESSEAWDKRGYWKKAADFETKWEWTSAIGPEIEGLIRAEDWERIPDLLVRLFPYFSGIEINKMTRKESDWAGSYRRLMDESGTE